MLTYFGKHAKPTGAAPPEITDISRHARACVHYGSGRPLLCVPIIRCDSWMWDSLVNSYILAETRVTY